MDDVGYEEPGQQPIGRGRRSLSDGLEALRAVLSVAEIMRLIEHTARWVDPATFRLLPVWFPEFARRSPIYKANWTVRQPNTNRQTGVTVDKVEANVYAGKALTMALGLRSGDRPNWTCCHIWGVDDPLFQQANAVVQNPSYYSCVANMVLLPTPLKAFTDAMPEVKAMLRICARNLYGWSCDAEGLDATITAIDAWGDWTAYPASWPRHAGEPLPLGVMPLNDAIRADAATRLARIRHDLVHAGEHYPRESVCAVLTRWNIDPAGRALENAEALFIPS